MPPKRGGNRGGGGGIGVGGRSSRVHSKGSDNQSKTSNNNTKDTVQGGKGSLPAGNSQSKFGIAPLVLEGVKVNKMQLNDLLKQQLNDVKVNDIQLSLSGSFTLYASDVKSFNRLLNDFTPVLSINGHQGAKIFVPRSIQRVKDTEKVAFVKRVDLELPEDRIVDALKAVGLDVINVLRLNGKDGKTPTRTIKITFSDVQNRNTFVHIGLQVDSMHFLAEAASQNTKPVQCFICLKYGHIAKYCKTKQQVCSRCGDNHRIEQCTVATDAGKCCNCKGNHLATSKDCSQYIEQERKMVNMINQYSSTGTTKPLAPFTTTEFPPLPNFYQQQKEILQSSLFDDILNALTSKMESIIENTVTRIFKKLQQRIEKIEKSIGIKNNINNDDDDDDEDALFVSDSDSSEGHTVLNYIQEKQSQRAAAAAQAAAATATTSRKQTSTTDASSTKPKNKNKGSQAAKRSHSPNSSLDASTLNKKDLKTSNNDD